MDNDKKATIGKKEILELYEEGKQILKSDKFKQYVKSVYDRYTDRNLIASDIFGFAYGNAMASIMERAGYSKEEIFEFIEKDYKPAAFSLDSTKDTDNNKVIPYKGRNKKCKN